jgi:hypothetical protein
MTVFFSARRGKQRRRPVARGSGEGVAGGGGQGRHEHPGALAHPRSYLALLEAVPSTVATGAGDSDGDGPMAAVLGGAETDEDGRVAPGEQGALAAGTNHARGRAQRPGRVHGALWRPEKGTEQRTSIRPPLELADGKGWRSSMPRPARISLWPQLAL